MRAAVGKSGIALNSTRVMDKDIITYADPETLVKNPGDILDRAFFQWPSIRDRATRKFQAKKEYQPKQLPHVVLFILASIRKGNSQFPLPFLKRFLENNYSGGSERDLPLLMKILNETLCEVLDIDVREFKPIRRQGEDWVFSRELRMALSPQKPESLPAPQKSFPGAEGEKMLNPYLNRKMIKDPAAFFGRSDDLHRIFLRLEGSRPQCISIIGERRIGKSSLLWHLHDSNIYSAYLSEPDRYVFLFLDLQEQVATTTEGFFNLLFHTLNKLRPDIPCQGGSDYSSFKTLAENFEASGLRLILLLDEFDKVTMNKNFDPEFFLFLRSMSNRYELALVTSSVKVLQQLCASKEIESSPFFNIFTPLYLSVFKPDEARDFIRESSRTTPQPLEKWTDSLLELGGHHPFFLQLACSALFESICGKGEKNPLWPQARESFLKEAEDHFIHFWSHMDQREREVVRNVARGEQLTGKLDHVLRDMKKKGIAYEFGNSPIFFSPLFTECVLELTDE